MVMMVVGRHHLVRYMEMSTRARRWRRGQRQQWMSARNQRQRDLVTRWEHLLTRTVDLARQLDRQAHSRDNTMKSRVQSRHDRAATLHCRSMCRRR
jgi:hypothetical protein